MQDHPVRLCLEPLEDRCVLSTTRLIGGNLFINADKTGGAITLNAVADNTFQLSGTVAGRFQAGGNLFIFGSDSRDVVTLNLGAFNFGGNAFIITKNGNDVVNVTGTGKLGGNIHVITGLGNDQTNISGPIGGTVTFHSQGGNDSFSFGNGASIIGGDLTVSNARFVNLGTGADKINGNVNVNSTLVNTGINVTTGAGTTIAGNLHINGGAGADVVTFNAGAINGLVSVNLGEGANRINNTGALTVGGDFNAFTGTGADSLTLSAGSVISGSTHLEFGEGTNDLTGLNNAYTVQGSVNLFLGNGNNTPFTFGGTVDGDANFHLGNGNNNVTMAGAIAGQFTWNSGNGNDTLTLAYSAAVPQYIINIRFGNADDVFATTGTGTLLGSVDGGRRFFGNTFAASAGTTLTSIFSLSNFP